MKALALVLSLVCIQALGGEPSHAMWVYHTEALQPDSPTRTELFTFCEARHITDLFWSVHYQPTAGALEIANAAGLRGFIKAATAHGLKIHVLSGDPSHALPKNWDKVIQRVEATAAFNHGAPIDERIAGIHFDIEPHGLPEWKSAMDSEKAALLTQFVEVNAKACERLRSLDSAMLYGVDITFWFDKTKPDGSPFYPVTYHGVTKDATKHLLDFADNVGIMSYRNSAEGKNGIIDLVTKTIAYADTAKGKAYVGVKMANIGPAMEGFFGQSEAAMQQALKPIGQAFSEHRGYAGLAYFMYEAYRVMPRD